MKILCTSTGVDFIADGEEFELFEGRCGDVMIRDADGEAYNLTKQFGLKYPSFYRVIDDHATKREPEKVTLYFDEGVCEFVEVIE